MLPPSQSMSRRSGDAGELPADFKRRRSPPLRYSERQSPHSSDGSRLGGRKEGSGYEEHGRSLDGGSSGQRRRYEDRRSYRDEHQKDPDHYAETSARPLRHEESRRERRRSRSPVSSFARDRAREREAYDRKHGTGPAHASLSPSLKDSAAVSAEPDFKPSGLLAKESNSKNGVTLKYFEPPEARKPKKRWRLYIFKDGKEVDMIHIARQSCYLMGRDQAVADIPVEHVSVSKQHAVIQYRNITERNEYGDEKRTIKPFLIDLDSANGCIVNGKEIPPSRYYELRNGDTIKLGGSQREYVLLAEEA